MHLNALPEWSCGSCAFDAPRSSFGRSNYSDRALGWYSCTSNAPRRAGSWAPEVAAARAQLKATRKALSHKLLREIQVCVCVCVCVCARARARVYVYASWNPTLHCPGAVLYTGCRRLTRWASDVIFLIQ